MTTHSTKTKMTMGLKSPHITEKASMLSASVTNPAYVFIIDKGMNKLQVMRAVKTVFNVTPARVSIVNLPAKKVFSRGKAGIKSGIRKAVVYLKKGEKIDIV